jgi:hypothetical protein
MTAHLLFYFAEATLVAATLWLALVLGINALRRIGIEIRLRWTVLVTLWICVLCIDTLFSEALGPEFTLLDLFAFWILVGAAVLWLVVALRAVFAAVRSRLTARPVQQEEQV